MDETNRMLRFATPKLQEKFALTRGNVRFLLGEYLQCAPQAIQFSYQEWGKPFLPNHAIQFNLAHSGDYCAAVLTAKDLIGVDIEKCEDTQRPHLEIAKRFFTSAEFEAVRTATDPELLFFHIWTQKEAFLKAIGQGIAAGLHQFEVATDLTRSEVKNIGFDEYRMRQFDSRSFDFLKGYRLTVTKEDSIEEVKLFLPA